MSVFELTADELRDAIAAASAQEGIKGALTAAARAVAWLEREGEQHLADGLAEYLATVGPMEEPELSQVMGIMDRILGQHRGASVPLIFPRETMEA